MGWLLEAFERVASQETGRHRAFTAPANNPGKMVIFPVKLDDLERAITHFSNQIVLAETDREKIDNELKARKAELEKYVQSEQDRFDEYVAGLIRDLDEEFNPRFAENTTKVELLKKDLRERREIFAERARHCGIKAEVPA